MWGDSFISFCRHIKNPPRFRFKQIYYPVRVS